MSEWQPIESAPKDGKPIIVLDDGDVRVAAWSGMLGKFSGTGGNIFNYCENATHWMPLPTPPEQLGGVS